MVFIVLASGATELLVEHAQSCKHKLKQNALRCNLARAAADGSTWTEQGDSAGDLMDNDADLCCGR